MCLADNEAGSMRAIAILSLAAAFFIEDMYNVSLKALIKTMFSEEYSYVLVVAGMLIMITIFEYRGIKILSTPDIGNLLVGSTLITLSFTTLILSNLLDLYILQFKTFSLVLLLWGIATLVLDRGSIRRLSYPMLALLLLIPLPREVIDPVSGFLSLHTARLASLLTGAELVADPSTQTYILRVVDNEGVLRTFNIAPICSGYVSIMNILALSIVVVYFAWRSDFSRSRRIIYSITLLGLGVVLVYLGNLLRVALVIWITRIYGFELALTFFHQAPSLIYSLVGALLVVILSIRLFRWRGFEPPSPSNVGGVRPINIIAILVLIVIFASLMAYTYPAVQAYVSGGDSRRFTTLDELLTNTSYTLFGGLNASINYVVDEPALAEVLGATIVKRFSITYNGSVYDGYIEVAESPGRYHSWSVCLTVQGYQIASSWSVSFGDETYTFYKFSRDPYRMLMGLSIYSVPVYIGGEKATAFIRISIIKYGWGGEEDILSILRGIKLTAAQPSDEPLLLWVNASIVLVTASIIYVVASIFIKYRRALTRIFPVIGG